MKILKKNKLSTFYISVPNMQVIHMFEEAGYKQVQKVASADFFVFPGGSDVIPLFYGEKPLKGTTYNLNRDLNEAALYRKIPHDKPKIGICRGSQFLCVMNGGRLWQDVNNHTRDHPIWDIVTKRVIPGMVSTHHQMMRLPDHAQLIAAAKESTRKESEHDTVYRDDKSKEYDDPEVVFFSESKTLCFQPHPEYNNVETREYFFSLFDRYVVEKGSK